MHILLRIITAPFYWLAHLIAFTGMGLLIYEGVQWYQSGAWTPLSLNDALWKANWLLPYTLYDWLNAPSSLVGLNKIVILLLQRLPAGLIFTGLGLVIIWILKPMAARSQMRPAIQAEVTTPTPMPHQPDESEHKQSQG